MLVSGWSLNLKKSSLRGIPAQGGFLGHSLRWPWTALGALRLGSVFIGLQDNWLLVLFLPVCDLDKAIPVFSTNDTFPVSSTKYSSGTSQAGLQFRTQVFEMRSGSAYFYSPTMPVAHWQQKDGVTTAHLKPWLSWGTSYSATCTSGCWTLRLIFNVYFREPGFYSSDGSHGVKAVGSCSQNWINHSFLPLSKP